MNTCKTQNTQRCQYKYVYSRCSFGITSGTCAPLPLWPPNRCNKNSSHLTGYSPKVSSSWITCLMHCHGKPEARNILATMCNVQHMEIC